MIEEPVKDKSFAIEIFTEQNMELNQILLFIITEETKCRS
jgi:hypothetical protein